MTDPYYADDSVTVWQGDCLDVLATLPDSSVDSIVTGATLKARGQG